MITFPMHVTSYSKMTYGMKLFWNEADEREIMIYLPYAPVERIIPFK